jgi:hypothetical protein
MKKRMENDSATAMKAGVLWVGADKRRLGDFGGSAERSKNEGLEKETREMYNHIPYTGDIVEMVQLTFPALFRREQEPNGIVSQTGSRCSGREKGTKCAQEKAGSVDSLRWTSLN